MAFRVTYATLSADNDELHAGYDRGIEAARGWLGGTPQYLREQSRTVVGA